MKKRTNKVVFLPVILLVVLTILAGSFSVFGNEIEEKRRSVEQKQQQLDQKTREEQRLQQEKETAEQNKEGYTQQVEELNGQMLELQRQQQNVQEAIMAGEARLKTLLEQKKSYEQRMKKRIRFLYEDGRSSLTVALLSAHSVSEFVNRFDYIADMSKYDRDQMEGYQKLSAVIEEEKTALTEKQAQLEAIVADTQNTLASYEALAAEAARTASASEHQRSEVSREKQTLSSELAGEQAELDRLVAEAKAAEEANAAAVEAARKAQEEAIRQAAKPDRPAAEQGEAANKPDNSQQAAPSGPTVPQHSGAYAYTADELNKMTAIVYCEAGGEPYIGQVAVASVILNRVDSSSFANTIEGVIMAPYQFSPTIDYTGHGSRYQLILKDVIANPGKYQSVRNASLAALAGEKPVGHFLFFHTIQLGPESGGIVIGNHVFYEVWVQHDYN
ncbi:MAG: cell wall hydrolase [Lachnospiraceae bacterium]|nr:cell wall hydrolase [Lachnospiraceae bacterium]MDY5742478.1 cell wall hydrolase [Lachnospiraceae bacterium]